MIEHELILLGLLKESPKHGYEIKKKIKEIVSLFAGVSLKSIYYPLRILEQRNLVTKRSGKAGRRPLRFVYALTQKGEARFRELVAKSFLNFKRPQFSLDISLYFLNYVDPRIVKRRLRARMLLLAKLSRSLKESARSLRRKKPASISRILEHNLQMVEAESKFLSGLIKTLK
ncbi:MAG: PadR family transcriptional regulator [Candidatus Omnitrophica bacterium]|nr:PadR family transcriptional regulator [Candidatus Omnitrophota bacterium]MDD5553071.1 PadR family transcriptional regulator [Candidatus Omnitrophota bacterium]